MVKDLSAYLCPCKLHILLNNIILNSLLPCSINTSAHKMPQRTGDRLSEQMIHWFMSANLFFTSPYEVKLKMKSGAWLICVGFHHSCRNNQTFSLYEIIDHQLLLACVAKSVMKIKQCTAAPHFAFWMEVGSVKEDPGKTSLLKAKRSYNLFWQVASALSSQKKKEAFKEMNHLIVKHGGGENSGDYEEAWVLILLFQLYIKRGKSCKSGPNKCSQLLSVSTINRESF